MSSVRRKIIIVFCTCFLALAVAPAQMVYADTDGQKVLDKIWDKAAARQLYWCYREGGFKPSVVSANLEHKKKGLNAISTEKYIARLPAIVDRQNRSGDTSGYSCDKLVERILEREGKSADDVGAVLSVLGYEKGDEETKTAGNVKDGQQNITMTTWTLKENKNDNLAKSAIKDLLSFENISDQELTQNQKAVLYLSYLRDFYGSTEDNGGVVCGKKNIDALDNADEYKAVKIFDADGNVKKNCVAKAMQYGSFSVAGTENRGASNYYMHDEMSSFEDVCAALAGLTITKLTGDQLAALGTLEELGSDGNENGTDETGTTEEGAEGEDDPCFNLSGAVGWMFCPVVNLLANALDSVYGSWIEPLLATSPGVIQALRVNGGDGNRGIYVAWGIFRDIANVMFVILLLVVIFSQVTGFGIDNYGIKRMLPRLIIAAILVNFSFLICQLAVDISNILGAGLKDFFVSVANNNITMAGERAGAVENIGDFMSYVLTGLGIVGLGTAIFHYGSQTNWAFLLSIGVTLLVAVIGVLFGFLLLGVRQAAVVLLVVTSPVALILYMMPNTYKYFQQWLRLFSRMLLVYPACGLLIGGGYFAARIILSVDDGLIFNLIGLILLIVPYFLIIPLVRVSMNSIAGIGGRIQAIGAGFQRGAGAGIRGSETYKNIDTQIRGANMARRASQLQDRMNRRNRRNFLGRVPGNNVFSRSVRNASQAVTDARNRADMAVLGQYAGAAEKEQWDYVNNLSSVDALEHPDQDMKVLKARLDSGNLTQDEFNAVSRRLVKMDGGKEYAKWVSGKVFNEQFGHGENAQADREVLNRIHNYSALDADASKKLGDIKPVGVLVSSNGAEGMLFNEDGTGNVSSYGGKLGLDDAPAMDTHSFRMAAKGGWFDQETLGSMLESNAPDRIKQRIAGDEDKRAVAEEYGVRTLHYSDGANVEGANGQVLSGKVPPSSFGAVTGAATTAGGNILTAMSDNGEVYWNATTGKNLSAEEASALLSGDGTKILRTGDGRPVGGASVETPKQQQGQLPEKSTQAYNAPSGNASASGYYGGGGGGGRNHRRR